MSTITFTAADDCGTPASEQLLRDVVNDRFFDDYRDAIEIIGPRHERTAMTSNPYSIFGLRLDDRVLEGSRDPVDEFETLAHVLYHILVARGLSLTPEIYVRQVVTVAGQDFERNRTLHWASCESHSSAPRVVVNPRPPSP